MRIEGTHIDKDEEELSTRVGTYREMRDERYRMAAEIVAP